MGVRKALSEMGVNLQRDVDDATVFRIKQALSTEDEGPALPEPVMVWCSREVEVSIWADRWIELWRDAWGKYTANVCDHDENGDTCGQELATFVCDDDESAKTLACAAWAAKLQGVIDEIMSLQEEQ